MFVSKIKKFNLNFYVHTLYQSMFKNAFVNVSMCAIQLKHDFSQIKKLFI